MMHDDASHIIICGLMATISICSIPRYLLLLAKLFISSIKYMPSFLIDVSIIIFFLTIYVGYQFAVNIDSFSLIFSMMIVVCGMGFTMMSLYVGLRNEVRSLGWIE